MKALEQLERIKRMNQLIKAECTGTPDEFSSRLGISRRQLYSDIEFVNDVGAKIAYSKSRKTFFYLNDRELEVSFTLKVITKENAKDLNGGFFIKKIESAFIMHGTNLNWT